MKKIFYIIVALSITGPFIANAKKYYWNVSSGNWNTAGSWSNAGYGGSSASTAPSSSTDSIYIGNNSNTTVTINGNDTITNLYLQGTGEIFINKSSSDTLFIKGNIYDTNSNGTGGGTAIIVIAGNSAQIIAGTNSIGVGKLPNLIVKQKSGGSFAMNDTLTMGGSTTLTYVSGTLTTSSDTSSLVVFYYDNTIAGSWTFNNVNFQGTISTITISSTITVNGRMTISGSSGYTISGSTIDLSGNLLITNNCAGGGGTTVINLDGSGSQQINSSNTTEGVAFLPSVTISSRSSGTVSLYGVISVQTAWTNNLATSQINPGTAELCFYVPNSTVTIGGSHPTPIYNLSFGYSGDPSNATYSLGLDSAIIVHHTLKFQGNQLCIVNNYSIATYGNVIVSNGVGGAGSATLYFKGSNVDTLSSTVALGKGALGAITVLKSGGSLLLSGLITVFGNWNNNFSSSNLLCGTSTVWVYSPNGTLSFGGTHTTTFYVLWMGGGNCTYNLNEVTAAIVTDTFRMRKPLGNLYINYDTIQVQGQIVNEGTADDGGAYLVLTGSSNQIIDGVSSTLGYWFPQILLRKSGGTVTLLGVISLPNSHWTNNYSTSNINYGTATIYFGYSNATSTWGGSHPTPVYKLILANGNCTFNLTHDSAFIVEDTLLISSGTSSTYSMTGNALVVLGNVVNNHGSVPSFSNKWIFGGGNNQTISGANGLTLYNVAVQKSGGTITLDQPIAVSNSLAFTKGIINTTSTDLLTFNSGSTVSGASDTGYVNGPVAKIGTAAFTFPIGSTVSGTNAYAPIGISAPTSSDTWTASYHYGSGCTSLYSRGTGVTYVDPCEYWLLTNSGSSSVKTTLNWNSPCFSIASLSYVSAAYVNSGHTTWDSTATTGTSGNTSAGSLTSYKHSLWDTVTIALTNQLITITATNTAVCNGASTTLGSDVTVSGGTGGYTYKWSPATGLSSSTVINPTATPTTTTTYTLTVTDAITESSSATVVVTVNPLPGDSTGTNKSICNGLSTTIGRTNTTGHTYSWSPSTGLSSSTLSNPTASPTTTTTYTLTETITATGCSVSNGITVTVNPFPGDSTGANKSICDGTSTTIGKTNTTGYAYSWSPSTGLSNSTVSNPTASPTTTTTYTLTETITATGCSVSNDVTVTVNPLPGDSAGANKSICDGLSTTIGKTNTTGHTYSWSPSTGLSSTNISSPTASPTTTTTYTLTETITATECSVANNVVVTVNQNPVPNAGRDTTICSGSGVTIGASPIATMGLSPYSYNWVPAYALSNPEATMPVASPPLTTIYTLTVIDQNHCQSEAGVKITVLPFDLCIPCGITGLSH